MTTTSQEAAAAKEDAAAKEITMEGKPKTQELNLETKGKDKKETRNKNKKTTKMTEAAKGRNNEDEVDAWELARETENESSYEETTTEKDDYGEHDLTLNDACENMDWGKIGEEQEQSQKNETTKTSVESTPGWTQVNKKKRDATIYNAEETDTRVNENVKEIMKKRGERAVEANTDKDTPVQVEFKVTKTAKSFNLRDALGKLLTTMIEVDASVKIQSKGGDEVWNDPNELPVGESMQDHFKVRQDTPPYEAPRITIYFTVKSTWKVNDIKYDPHMITYLKNFNIFMRPDRYSTSKVRSPGYFVKIAPRLVWKQDVVQELKDKVGKPTLT